VSVLSPDNVTAFVFGCEEARDGTLLYSAYPGCFGAPSTVTTPILTTAGFVGAGLLTGKKLSVTSMNRRKLKAKPTLVAGELELYWSEAEGPDNITVLFLPIDGCTCSA
jgi:hypothetical protein